MVKYCIQAYYELNVTDRHKALLDLRISTHPIMSITAGVSPFAGGPDSSIDLAWHTLLGNTSIEVSQNELGRNGNHQESVSTADGKYMVWLGVFHQLHCIVHEKFRPS